MFVLKFIMFHELCDVMISKMLSQSKILLLTLNGALPYLGEFCNILNFAILEVVEVQDYFTYISKMIVVG